MGVEKGTVSTCANDNLLELLLFVNIGMIVMNYIKCFKILFHACSLCITHRGRWVHFITMVLGFN